MKPSRRASVIFLAGILGLVGAGTLGAPPVQAQAIQVNSADPASAEQGTVNLDVLIRGNGFKKGAIARFFVTGTANPGGITVRATTFLSSGELIANIDVADTAVIANFDIEVQNSNGRTGKGIELFSVNTKGSGGKTTTSCVVPQPALTTTVSCTSASPGCLDTSFGGTGAVFVDTDNGGYNDYGNVVLVQPDGKILVIGQGGPTGTPTYGDVFAARFHMDGGLDQSFGNGGVAIINVSNYTDSAYSALLQSDGKILIGGSYGGGLFAVVRLNHDGSADGSFGTNGVAVIDFGRKGGGEVWGLALQSDGKIVAAGGGRGPDWSIARLNSNGTLDTTFANRGLLIAKSGGGVAEAVKMQTVMVNGNPVERILIAGRAIASNNVQFGLMRFTLSGDLDTSFGAAGTGKTITQFCTGSGGYPRGMEFDVQGRIVVGGIFGTPESGSDNEFVVARYTPNGVLDTTFGSTLPGSTQRMGYTPVDFLGGWDQVYGVAIQADGKILLSGYVWSLDGTKQWIGLVRFDSDGTLDPTFGNNGLAVGGATPLDAGHRLALDAYGRILVPTRSGAGNVRDTGLFRFWP